MSRSDQIIKVNRLGNEGQQCMRRVKASGKKSGGNLWPKVHMLMKAFYLVSMAVDAGMLESNRRAKAKWMCSSSIVSIKSFQFYIFIYLQICPSLSPVQLLSKFWRFYLFNTSQSTSMVTRMIHLKHEFDLSTFKASSFPTGLNTNVR